MKKIISLILILCLAITIVPYTVFAAEVTEPDPASYPDFADVSYGSLYAHATLGGSSKETWQRWHKDEQGVNFESGLRYFFLPASADDEQVEIYNNYNTDVLVGDVTIEPYTSAFISYEEGKPITAKRSDNNKTYSLVVYKSDAEASVYVNDTTNSYEDYNGEIQNTDFWSFLTESKENSVKDSSCSIVDENGTLDTTLKKIKGRGNTNWKYSDKKPFNLTFYDKTDIGGVVDKKFSFVSSAKDSTLLRNAVMYDLAYNVGSPYAVDQSFVDFYVNGVYKGAYIACRKVDLGKNSVVSLKDTSDDVDSDFNFLVEVDVWNYNSDVYFVTDKGYHVVLKTPDLDDYDETDPSMKAKYDYIKNTYQKLEDAIYSGTLSDVEKICDLDSLASQYLLQEFGKNCDGGYTSTFFTYNAEEGKFYAAPLWDCDSTLGAVDCVRDGCKTSTIDHTGWVTRLATYEKTVNPLGQMFKVKGTNSEGFTFEEICADMWHNTFIPEINVLLGKAESNGRLKSINDYANSIEKSAYNNYVMWDFAWLCSEDNSSLSGRYSKDYEGEIQYMIDWAQARANWMSNELKPTGNTPVKPTTTTTSTEPDNSTSAATSTAPATTTPAVDDNTVYFKTDLDWDDVHYYVWDYMYVPAKWPGEKAELVSVNEDTNEALYKINVPDDVSYIIFNNGATGAQTVDITLSKGVNLYVSAESTGAVNEARQPIYNVSESVYTEPITTAPVTTEPEESTDDEEITTVTLSTEPTEPQMPSESATAEATDPSETVAPTNTSSSTTSTQPATYPEDDAKLGDVNLDGKINIKDATALQKHLAKLQTLSDKSLSVSDTNKDGRITIADATAIQKKIAGLISWE